MPDDQISLRPRMTILSDLHPELYDLFKRTPEKRHNALAMQMLVRMATIERYSGLGSRSSTREEAMRGRVLPNDKADDQIGLRPRLTIFKDLHPELYDQFKRTTVSSHNGLAMQMLVRMATLEHHEGIGLWGIGRDGREVAAVATDAAYAQPITKVPVKARPASFTPTAVKAEDSPPASLDSDSLSILALKNAVGDMFG